MLASTKKFSIIIFSLCAVFLLLSLYVWFDYNKNKQLKVIFLDVGQGDSVLIRTPSGSNILIDGGENSIVAQKLGEYLPFYDKTIDLMILSHPHSDHVGGFPEILKRYNVKQILATGVVHTSPDYLAWLSLIQEKGIKFIKASGEREIIFNNKKEQDVVLKILYPFEDISQNSFKDLNDSSIVVKLIFGDSKFLFVGDLAIEGEEVLMKNDVDLQSDVLKVGHHGSKYSSSLEFLKKVDPEYGVIQSGKDNKFGHPHLRAIRNLEKSGIDILRNDNLQDIIFESDGENLIYLK